MQTSGRGNGGDDRFIFVGCGGKQRRDLIFKLRERCGDVEVLAPVEKRMVRPRRKSSKREALFVEIPLFYEYLAINLEQLEEDWEWLMQLPEVWFVLLDCDLRPKLAKRQDLKGLLQGESLVSWEGAMVEFIRGPFIGQKGLFANGRVCLGKWGKPKVNVFDLVRAS